MQFKDRLKALRLERGISQQQLADAIYVSRSAVAKWENGLGLPGKPSYEALLLYFDVSSDELSLSESDGLEVGKRRRTRVVISAFITAVIVFLNVGVIRLLWALNHGYGFTADDAVGEYWANDDKIETQNYTIYYTTTAGELTIIDRVCVAEKRFIGYQKIDISQNVAHVYDEAGQLYGHLYSFFDTGVYYNFFGSVIYIDMEAGESRVHVLNEVFINGKERDLFLHSLFETDFPVTEFSDGEADFTVVREFAE